MPNVYDPRGHQLRITHSPTERTPFEFGKLPKLDLQVILGSVRDQLIQQIKDLTGLDLSSPQAFLASLIQIITNDGPGGGFAAKIIGIISDFVGVSDFLTKLSRMLTNLRNVFGGIDFGASGFNLVAAISGLIDNLLPHGRLAELVFGRLKDGQEPQKLIDVLGNLRNIFGGNDPGDPGFNLSDGISGLIDILLPHGRLAELLSGRLKDGQEPLSWQNFLDGVKGSGGGVIDDVVNKLTHLDFLGRFDAAQLSNLANIPDIAQEKIANLVADLSAKALGSDLQNIIDRFWGQIFGDDNAVGHTINDFRDAVRSLFNLSSNADSNAHTGLQLLNFPRSQPIFGHTNPTMQVPIGFLHLRKFTASGSTVATHTDPESITATQTASVGMFDRFDKSRDTDLVTIFCKAIGTISAMKVHLWRMDTTTGDKSFIQSETVNPAVLPIASFDNVYIPLTTPVHVDPGAVIGREVAITGPGTLAISGVNVPWLKDDLSARPRRIGFSRAVNAAATPPATIADASVGYNTTIPVIGLGQAVSALPDPKYSFTESFNGNTASWRALAGGLLFSSGLFQTATAGANFALFNLSTYGDSVHTEFNFQAAWSPFLPSFNSGDIVRLAICCSSTASQYVALEIMSNRSAFSPGANHTARIVTGTSPTATPTTRTSVAINGDYTGFLSIEYSLSTNTYNVYGTGVSTPILTWPDSGNAIQHGPNFRQAAVYANFGTSVQPVCDSFLYKDV